MDESTEEERLGFVRSYGVEPVTDINTDLTFKDAATAVAEMTPIIGDAIAAKEVYDELMKDEPNYGLIAALGGAALVGAIPGIGDAAAAGIRKAVDVAKRVEVDPDAVGMMGGNIRIKPKAEQGTPTVEAAGLTDEAIDKWRKENATPEDFRKSLKGRNEELQEAAAGVEEGRVFTSTYRKLADDLRPIRKVNEVPKPATFVEAVSALNAGKRKKPMIGLNASIPDGDEVTARLDIDAYTDYDVWVPTLTHPELKTVYKPSVILEDVTFIKPEGREPKKALGVAKGGAKAPFAVMTGKYVEASDDEAFKLAKDVFDNDDITQVGYDPTRRGFFYDRETGEAVVQADTVIQVGHLVLARNAKKMDAEAFPFNEGGIAMEKQMEMNFGEVPDNTVGVDPVSGNDIPMGATAANVRDDVPAFLSEGEIVVPADVVNFHGVKLFEDLRAEAKMGYAQMAEDGRMGGQPIDDDNDIGLEFADLEIMIVPDEGMEEEPVEMSRGGTSMRDYSGAAFKAAQSAASKRNPSRTAQQTHDQIMASFRGDDDRPSRPAPKPVSYYSPEAISTRVQARKDKPKNRFEAIQQKFKNLFRADDDDSPSVAKAKRLERVKLATKPADSDDERSKGTIAEQINFGGDYDQEYEVTPKKEKKKKAPTIQEDAAKQREEQEKFSVRYADKGFGTRLLEGLGFNEGTYMPEPFYDQRGGFGPVVYGGIQAREYMNDAGHRIIIMFKDGVPLTPIPEGYYPVSLTVTPDAASGYTPEAIAAMTGYGGAVAPMGMGASGDGSDPGANLNMELGDPVIYEELSVDELRNMIEEQGGTKQKAILAGASAINPIMGLAVRAAMWDTSRRTKNEIERRLESEDTSEVDKMRLTNLLEIADREDPSLFDKLTGKAFEKEYSQIPSPDIPSVDFSDPTLAPDQGIAAPYTPEVTTPSVADPDGITEEMIEAAKEASRIAAINAFGLGAGKQPEVETVPLVPGTGKTLDEITQTQPTFETPTADTQRRKDFGQNVAQNLAGRSTDRKTSDVKIATRGLSESEKKGGAGLDSRFGITGLNEGGLVEEPVVKEVVKGLKKASKTHAKQAGQLEKALKASKKKKKSK